MLALTLGLLVAIASVTTPGADIFANATIDAAGTVSVITGSGRVLALKRRGETIAVAPAKISPDGLAVAWLERYSTGAATTYPFQLMVYRGGKLRTFSGIGLPIFRWAFLAKGRRVAFEQEFTHGSAGVHYELHDIVSGRRVDEYDPTSDPDMDPGVTPRDAPTWVKELNATQP